MKKLLISIFLLLTIVLIPVVYDKMDVNKGCVVRIYETMLDFYKKVLKIIDEIPMFGDVTPRICSEEDLWVGDPSHKQDGKVHYFMGWSFGHETVEDAENKAKQYGLVRINNFIASRLNSRKEPSIQIKDYDIIDLCYDGADGHYNAAVKISTTDEEIKRIISINKRREK